VPVDDQSAPAPHDDHCLVHHFIRTHGRRPDDDELQALRERVAVPRPRRSGPPLLSQALRREAARLIQRL
jgi:hypothetical protein